MRGWERRGRADTRWAANRWQSPLRKRYICSPARTNGLSGYISRDMSNPTYRVLYYMWPYLSFRHIDTVLLEMSRQTVRETGRQVVASTKEKILGVSRLYVCMYKYVWPGEKLSNRPCTHILFYFYLSSFAKIVSPRKWLVWNIPIEKSGKLEFIIERVLMDFNEDRAVCNLWRRLGIYLFFHSRLSLLKGRAGWPFSVNWNTQSCPTNPKTYWHFWKTRKLWTSTWLLINTYKSSAVHIYILIIVYDAEYFNSRRIEKTKTKKLDRLYKRSDLDRFDADVLVSFEFQEGFQMRAGLHFEDWWPMIYAQSDSQQEGLNTAQEADDKVQWK